MFRIVIIFALLLNIGSAFAQSADDRKFALAMSYEESGAYDDASRLYLEIYNNNKKNDEYFGGVERTYRALNRFGELLEITKERISLRNTFKMRDLYAEMLWRSGQNDEANAQWRKCLDDYSGNEKMYLRVAITQGNLRLLEKAAQTLIEGREEIGVPDVYSDELSKIYISLGNYQDGTDEIIRHTMKTRDIPQAQGRLFALMINDEAAKFIKNRLAEKSEENDKSLFILELYSFVLRNMGQFDQAFETVRKIDKLRNANGRDILSFADISRKDGQTSIALKAYSELIDMGKSTRFLPTALYGYARTLEEKLNLDTSISKQDAGEVISQYRNIIKKYPRQVNIPESKYRIANIALKFMDDPENAKKELNEILKQYKGNQFFAKAALTLGEIELKEGNIDEAGKYFNFLDRTYLQRAPEEYELGKYFRAKILYFQGHIDSALAEFNEVGDLNRSVAANDALNMITLINQNKELIAALQEYAAADFAEYQGNITDALEKYKKASEKAYGADLSERAAIKIIEILFTRKNYLEASKKALKLIELNPQTIYGDHALLIAAKSNEFTGKKQEAQKLYTRILSDYPRSIYLQQARDNIRRLRGESI